jgi:hypothetical protein
VVNQLRLARGQRRPAGLRGDEELERVLLRERPGADELVAPGEAGGSGDALAVPEHELVDAVLDGPRVARELVGAP